MSRVLAGRKVATGAGLRSVKPHARLREERQNVALEGQGRIAVRELSVRRARFDPRPDQTDRGQVTAVLAQFHRRALRAHLDAGSVAVLFGDVELPARRHAVISQPLAQFGMIPVEVALADFRLSENGNAGRRLKRVCARHDPFIRGHVQLVIRVLAGREVTAHAGLRALEPDIVLCK